ncbi:MAG: hypothetical protein NVV60_05335 [Luteimonas sp.]|nr:hypothetical protein [Luteimonas sp.]
MFERSEFGPRAPLTEKRMEPARRSRDGSRPAEGLLVPFGPSKGTRARSDRKLFNSADARALLLIAFQSDFEG